MSVPVLVFFNNKGGVGKTSLVYHTAWMFSDLGKRVVVADLDPQANLSAAFLPEERLEELLTETSHKKTLYGCILPLLKGTGDIAEPVLEEISDYLSLLTGDLDLTQFEDSLSESWPKCSDGNERAFRTLSAFWRVLQRAADSHQAEIILVDIGPNLGAINRSVVIASDYIVTPLVPDLYSIQGLRNLGPALREWRIRWQERLTKNPADDLQLPVGNMQPLGYIVMQHAERLDRPVHAYQTWVSRIPSVYRQYVLNQGETPVDEDLHIKNDQNCIALIKHFKSLVPLAQEARKPVFHLKPADGALGAHFTAAQQTRTLFHDLVKVLADKIGIRIEEND